MADQAWPFEAPGPGVYVTEDQFRTFFRALKPSALYGSKYTVTDVESSPAKVTVGTGNQVIRAAAPLGGLVDGIYWKDTASKAITVPTNTNANPRIDRTILRLDPSANTITTVVKLGTPGSSPVPPALTQDPAGTWEMSLYQHRMPGSASSQIPDQFIDERRWTAHQYGETRGYGTGANITPGGFFTELVGARPTIPAYVGEIVRVSYSAAIYLGDNNVQAINWGLVTTGMHAIRPVPVDHFRRQIPATATLPPRDAFFYSWDYLVTTAFPTVAIQIGNGTGPASIVMMTSFYDLEILG